MVRSRKVELFFCLRRLLVVRHRRGGRLIFKELCLASAIASAKDRCPKKQNKNNLSIYLQHRGSDRERGNRKRAKGRKWYFVPRLWAVDYRHCTAKFKRVWLVRRAKAQPNTGTQQRRAIWNVQEQMDTLLQRRQVRDERWEMRDELWDERKRQWMNEPLFCTVLRQWDSEAPQLDSHARDSYRQCPTQRSQTDNRQTTDRQQHNYNSTITGNMT